MDATEDDWTNNVASSYGREIVARERLATYRRGSMEFSCHGTNPQGNPGASKVPGSFEYWMETLCGRPRASPISVSEEGTTSTTMSHTRHQDFINSHRFAFT
jgi:hypothetical protein